MKKYILILPLYFLLIVSCKSTYYKQNTFDYSKPVNTADKKIDIQQKGVFTIDHIQVDNRFDGARMNGFSKLNDSIFQIIILPENEPINPSPWYAFKINSVGAEAEQIYLKISYPTAMHRYNPKISTDRINWKPIDSTTLTPDKKAIIFKLNVPAKPIWIAAQPIVNSNDVQNWIEKISQNKKVTNVKSIGKSVLQKDIPFFKIKKESLEKKSVILLMSRQHPPEITGYKAFQYFVEALLEDNRLSQNFYQKYEVWVFPLLNPDGVDLGNWRHNAHGIDLNRDWAYYKQPEINNITNFILSEAKKNKNKVVLGIDFHSTFKDVYYVYEDSLKTVLPEFHQNWTAGIDQLVQPFQTKYAPYKLTQPVSKNWFYNQFKAEGITYEVGDNTPENLIKDKAQKAAVLMMSLLLQP